MAQNGSESLTDKIIRQIEYYFGDVNLSKDKFLQEETQKDSGWVSLQTLLTFNRLKQLSTDAQVIVDALKKSTNDLLEIDEENKKVRRARPLPENLSEFETNLKQNTVYVKGFPGSLSLDDLFAFFEPHGKVLQVFMRRFPGTKQFKGSAFVTFETHDQMKAFLDLPEVKYKDDVLLRESQAAYLERKAPQLEKIKDAKKRKEQQKEEKQKQMQEAEEAYLREQKIPGAILHLKPMNEQATRENIKELFDNFAPVRYIDFNKGEPEAYVRFHHANKAKEALDRATEKAGGTLELKGAKIEARVLEGEEEEEHWKKIIQKLSESRQKGGRKQKGRRGGDKYGRNKHGGGERNNNKRSLSDDGDDDDNENKNGGGGAAVKEDKSEKAVENNNGGADEAGNKKLKVN